MLLVEGRPVRLWSPAMAASAPAAVHGSVAGGRDVVAPMQGTILTVLVSDGDEVTAGQPIVVLEAMKMETTVPAPRAGTVELKASPGDTAGAGQVLAVIE